MSCFVVASLSENSTLPPFLRNLVTGPVSRSTSASPQISPNSPNNLKYNNLTADEALHRSLMNNLNENGDEEDDYDDEDEDDGEFEEMDEVQDLRVSVNRNSHKDIREMIISGSASIKSEMNDEIEDNKHSGRHSYTNDIDDQIKTEDEEYLDNDNQDFIENEDLNDEERLTVNCKVNSDSDKDRHNIGCTEN